MKAAMVTPGDPSTAKVEQIKDPPEEDGAILVEGLLVGVCGTDVEIVEKGYGVPPPGHERMVLFHESLGRVLEAPEKSHLKAGDLVVGIVRRPDPVPCACCAAGEWDMCRNGRYTERGIKELDGYGAEQWRVESEFAVRLDPALERVGMLMEPASILAKAWDQIERIAGRACSSLERCVVTGAGPIGLLAALVSVQRGLETTVVDMVEEGVKPR